MLKTDLKSISTPKKKKSILILKQVDMRKGDKRTVLEEKRRDRTHSSYRDRTWV